MVVPTYNRGSFLPHLFEALAGQTYPHDRMEVLFVDDGSTDQTAELIRRWERSAGFQVSLLRHGGKGPASARNCAVAHAQGTVLAFTDSDCMPSPRWLSAAVAALDEDVGLVTGKISLARLPDTHFFFNSQLDPDEFDRGLYRTANLVVPRAVFDEAGGFDPSFVYEKGSGEDTDFGWRVRRAGKRAVFVADAHVAHLATPISPAAWMRKPLAFQVVPRLAALYPELRSTALFARYFMSPRHFIFDIAALGMLLALLLQSWPWLLLVVPWLVASSDVWFTMARLGRVHKAAAIQLLLIERYGLGLAVLLWSSIRHRALVL